MACCCMGHHCGCCGGCRCRCRCVYWGWGWAPPVIVQPPPVMVLPAPRPGETCAPHLKVGRALGVARAAVSR